MIKRAARVILNAAVYILIIVSIVWGLPQFLSWKLETPYPLAAITSGSMWPALKEGHLVLIKRVGKDEIKKSDIIVWKNERGFTIHRVVALKDKMLVTKGDANFVEDEPVRYENVVGEALTFRGKTARIPYLGFISVMGANILESAN